jgi:hypothetical protein
MAYILRFVQQYSATNREAFMALEAMFAGMERRRKDWPQGRRYQPLSGREPTNTLVWECEFPTLAEAQDALKRMGSDPEHEQLFRQQAPYITQNYTEIYEILEFH